MRRRFSILLLLVSLGGGLAARAVTALEAVKLLPKGVAENLAVIAGYEGSPVPAQWHLLAYEAEQPAGVHEYVVAGGELIASRPVSQFAESLRPEQVVGADAVKIDSDKVGKLAQQYAQENKSRVASYNLEMRRDGEGAVPLWRVACLDARGTVIGTVVVTATKGFVVSHEGFAKDPSPGRVASEEREPSRREEREPRRSEEREAKRAEEREAKKSEAKRSAPAASTPRPREAPPRPAAPPAPVATPLPLEPERRPGLIQRAGGSVRRVFGGREEAPAAPAAPPAPLP